MRRAAPNYDNPDQRDLIYLHNRVKISASRFNVSKGTRRSHTHVVSHEDESKAICQSRVTLGRDFGWAIPTCEACRKYMGKRIGVEIEDWVKVVKYVRENSSNR